MVFNTDEVLAMAEQIERNGQQFYIKAAELVSEPGTKQILTHLAHWEAGHVDHFAGLRSAMTEDAFPDAEDFAEGYLQAIASSNVFTAPPADTLTGKESPLEILEIALLLERTAILFYVGLQRAMPESMRPEVEVIIEEEMRHVAYLSERLQVLRP